MNKDVIVIGASGHGKVIADIIKKCGDNIIGFLDDDLSKPGVMGKVCECLKYNDTYFVIAIGNNKTRKMIAEKYDINYYTAIHPTAVIADDVTIGEGSVVMANAVINPSARIGKHCIINTAAVIEHDCVIADHVHVSPNATLCGTVTVGESAHIGASAVVRNNLNIGSNVTIGIGAAVVGDIDRSGVYVGVPARVLR